MPKPNRTRQYFDATPQAASDPTTLELSLKDLELTLTTDRGVFSRARIDPGTLALLRSAPLPPPDGDLLDLGCGYGPIALALAHRAPSARVWATDVNTRALDLTRRNAAATGAGNVTACPPDEVDPDVRFAAIYSNPPIRVGKAVLHDLLLTWLARLAPDGRAYLVVQRNLGADSLARWLTEQGHATTRLASKNGYRVLEVLPA